MFNIVLVEPEIPQNTGNIVRTAAATGCKVHLIKPLGFDISDRALKRAGLDYWSLTDFYVYENLDEFFEKTAGGRADKFNGYKLSDGAPHFYFCSTKGAKRYTDVKFSDGDYLVFGKETRGLPEWLLKANYDLTVRIPMISEARSLNLSNSVAIVVYEGLRQSGFDGLLDKGRLTGRID